jgi:hypothetical protein
METALDLFSDFPQEEMAMRTEFLKASYPAGAGSFAEGEASAV